MYNLYKSNSLGGTYFSAMDRGYTPLPSGMDPIDAMSGLSPADIGISAPPMQNQLEALQAKIRQGAKRVELGFMGRGKGSMSQGSTTPEMYGYEERRDMKELAALNKVILSTHATPAVGNLSGLTEGGFNEQAREAAFNEIRRAIDFAADVTQGGAVVLHTGEFQRPIFDNFGESFQMHPTEAGDTRKGEEKKSVFHIVDQRTGQMTPVRTDMPVPLPEWKRKKDGDYELDEKGEKVVDTEIDPVTGLRRYKTKVWKWHDFEDEAKLLSQKEGKPISAAVVYHKLQLEMQRLQMTALSHFYGGVEAVERTEKTLQKLNKAIEFYKRLEASLPDNEKWKIMRESREFGDLIPGESRVPSNLLETEKKRYEGQLQHLKYGAMTYSQQAASLAETQANLIPIREYAVKRSADTIARAAMFAMQKSQMMNTPEPIYVAPENIFPESYGSHPSELRELIVESRKSMAADLQKKFGYDKGHADELAAQHIRATWDTGHGYTWRKYFSGDPNKSIKENDQAFNKWMLNEVESLVKDGIIGHVHVSDNFGYEDEHVDPGMGRVPIKELIERFKKHGIKNVIVEPAHQDYRALLSGWRHFGSSIYGLGKGGDRWTDVWRGYFGQGNAPYFLYGEAAPDAENWVLWTGTRLE